MNSSKHVRGVVVALASLAAADWTEECKRFCTHTHFRESMLTQHCESYRYVLPKPKVYQKCKKAFDSAIQNTCPKVCSESNADSQHAASHHCKPEKNAVPRPISYEACMKGYTAGADAATKFGGELKEKAKEAEDDGAAEAAEAAAAAREAAAAAADAAKAAAAKKAAQAAAAA